MASVTLKNISKIYPGKSGGEVTAVGGLDLEVQDRELLILVGPPNCGISSVIRLIAGLETVSKGDISIGDRPVNDLPAKDRDIALVTRHFAPYPAMSVSDNLAFGLKQRKFPESERKKRVSAAAGVLGLEKVLALTPESLSDEQRQRVAIARAVVLQPKVFLFDEPLANLEPKAREEMRHEIVKLHQRLQTTMIYGTHDPMEAMALGGRIVVLNDGAIQQIGTAHALYQEPANVFVAGFMGSSSMNFVRGALKLDRDSLLFSEIEEGTIEVRLPIAAFPGARDFGAGSVILGIRPENIEIANVTDNAGKHPDSFPAIIEHVEPDAGGMRMYLHTGAHRLLARSDHQMDHQEAGHRSRFQINLAEVCLFDPVSGRRLV